MCLIRLLLSPLLSSHLTFFLFFFCYLQLKGNWKCNNCVSCQQCGRRTPGKNCEWSADYTLCGPCYSNTVCGVCGNAYVDSQLLVKCATCERWCHAACDQITSEDEVDFVVDGGYNCPLCRKCGAAYGVGHQQLLNFRGTHGSAVPFSASWRGEGVDPFFGEKLVSHSSSARSFVYIPTVLCFIYFLSALGAWLKRRIGSALGRRAGRSGYKVVLHGWSGAHQGRSEHDSQGDGEEPTQASPGRGAAEDRTGAGHAGHAFRGGHRAALRLHSGRPD